MYVQSCCFALSIAFFTFSSLLHLKLPTIYDTLWSVRNRIVSVQNAHADSILRFWLEKLGEWTGQLWRDNSPRVRNLEKNSGETVCQLGTIIQSIFCAQSGASIRLTVWKWSGKSRYPWALRSAHAWKLSSHLFSGPDLLSLGLRGCVEPHVDSRPIFWVNLNPWKEWDIKMMRTAEIQISMKIWSP